MPLKIPEDIRYLCSSLALVKIILRKQTGVLETSDVLFRILRSPPSVRQLNDLAETRASSNNFWLITHRGFAEINEMHRSELVQVPNSKDLASIAARVAPMQCKQLATTASLSQGTDAFHEIP